MDECTVPGIFWPYGNPAIKLQLAYLMWNNNCKHNLAQKLSDDCTTEQRRDFAKQLIYANSLVDQQSNEIVKLTTA